MCHPGGQVHMERSGRGLGFGVWTVLEDKGQDHGLWGQSDLAVSPLCPALTLGTLHNLLKSQFPHRGSED